MSPLRHLVPLGHGAALALPNAVRAPAGPRSRTPLGLPVRDSLHRRSAAAVAGGCRERGRVSALLLATAKIREGRKNRY